MTALFMNLSAFGTLLSGVLTITAKNPVISVIYLIFTFVFAAGYIILIGIQFIGISYIVIYVGAIAVLFLFVIMMINIKLTDILETGTQYTKNLPLAISIGSLFLYIIYGIIPFNFYNVPSLLISSFQQTTNTWGPAAVNIFNNNLFISTAQLAEPTNKNFLSNGVGEAYISFLPLGKGNIVEGNTDFNILNFLQIEVLGHNLYTYEAILLIVLSFILLLAMFATIVISNKK
jgi:NADH-ubiquinone oxidoreductase chain 6